MKEKKEIGLENYVYFSKELECGYLLEANRSEAY